MKRKLDWSAPIARHTVTYAEAIKMARSSKYRYRYIFAGTWCPFKINDLQGSTSRQGYVATSDVQVSLPALLSFMNKAFPEHVRDKVNVEVSTSDGFIWIGHSP